MPIGVLMWMGKNKEYLKEVVLLEDRMERCRVVSHMYVSIDGKIDGAYMEEDGCEPSGTYYDTSIWTLGDSMAGGRVTNTMYHAKAKVDLSLYQGIEVPAGDHILPAEHYHFCFDRNGKSMWESQHMEYGGRRMQNVSVVSPSVKKEYLAFLRDKKISYLIVSSLEEALLKIKKLFSVQTLVLTGGAIINGAFHKEGLIDELSIVMAPYIEGNHEEKGYAELGEYVGHKYIYKSLKALDDGGIHLLFERTRDEGGNTNED